ncbi:hypothetical protein HDV05_008001 [Chytridiales sp. JEL 0842]|nr:hypothetical protein HDV05_008001 [Chytridiales sp. JEL 0842]
MSFLFHKKQKDTSSHSLTNDKTLQESEIAAFIESVREQWKDHALIDTLDDADIERFYRNHRFHSANAMKHIGHTLDWRVSYKWSNILDEDFADISKTGKLSFFGKDKDGVPVMIWRACRHRPTDFNLERDVRHAIHSFEKAIRDGIVKDRVTVILDRLHMTQANYDSHLVKTLLAIQHHYPERLDKLFLFPKNMMLSVGLNVARMFVDPVTMGRVHILKEDEVKDVLGRYIDKEYLFEEYGGSCVDPWYASSAKSSSDNEEEEVEVAVGETKETQIPKIATDGSASESDDEKTATILSTSTPTPEKPPTPASKLLEAPHLKEPSLGDSAVSVK